MNTKAKIYIAIGLAALIITGLLIARAVTYVENRGLDKAVETQRSRADELEKAAVQKEFESARYRDKTEYLERRLEQTAAENRRQDERLEKLNIDTRDARARVARARSSGPTANDTNSLCEQLAGVGHQCGPVQPGGQGRGADAK